MPVPSSMSDLSVVAASNSPAGSDPVVTADDHIRALAAILRREQAKGATMPSGSTVNIGANSDGSYIHISGSATINGFGTAASGVERTVVFESALTLTHSVNLVLPGGANIATSAGDAAVFRSDGAGIWRCVSYSTASGAAANAAGLWTSLKATAMASIYPVGSIYIGATSANPATLLGFGAWTQIAQGRTLIGVGTLGTDTYAAGATGGTARVTLTTAEMPSHNHGGLTGGQSNDHTHSGGTSTDGAHIHNVGQGTPGINYSGSGSNPYFGAVGPSPYQTGEAGAHSHSFTTWGSSANHTHGISAEGGGGAHENRMPYLAVYFWQRTA